ncbi:ROK family protein [Alteromonas sp. a30]|uniref:ROK family protein n=1 Tax=Alteromonas sp. a30 TaxID=2730917 RepID=UPI00228186FD|nr:ROK family protein [Alteromonas sp. a30]MCY7297160.1 ROK family protein [Alteromonas sp. a30]
MSDLFAAIEAGGTKFNCALFDRQKNIVAEARIATTSPEETLGQCIAFFQQQREAGLAFSELGLATFGPVDLNPTSPTYGNLTTTPKPGWKNAPLMRTLAEALNCNVAIDTDVNAAARAEYLWGASMNTNVSIYVTVGTGVGAGVLINGKPLQGILHPEMGHILIGDIQEIQGVCPYHGSCVEGLASGAAMKAIWGVPAQELSDNHPAWAIQSKVLAKFCHNLLVSFSPERLILGGGVMAKPGLLESITQETESSLNHYLAMDSKLSEIIVPPTLGERSGILGALALAMSVA